jgi:hypothetical protein
MSFASDLGNLNALQFASEASFLSSNKSQNSRAYWENAKTLLFNFLSDHNGKIGTMVGLQEMNDTEFSGEYPFSGAGSIRYTLNKSFPNFAMVTKHVVTKFAKPALCILFDTTTFGVEKNLKL